MNIEKEFYKRVENEAGECSSLAYHFAEVGVLSTYQMERYLIKQEFKELLLAKKKKERIKFIVSDLSERFCKTEEAIRYILKKT